MARIKRILLVLFGMLCIPLILPILYFMLGGVSYLQGANLAPDDPALKTKYTFTFDNGDGPIEPSVAGLFCAPGSSPFQNRR